MPDQAQAASEAAAVAGAAADTTAAAAAIPPKPEGVPDKFYNAETGAVDAAGMGAAYTNMEQKLTAKAEPAKPDDAMKITPPQVGDMTEESTVDDLMVSLSLDPVEIGQMWREKGALTDDAYNRLATKGVTKGMVNQYMGALMSNQANNEATAKNIAEQMSGGEKQLTNLMLWAGSAYPRAKCDEYTLRLNDPNQTSEIMTFLMAQHGAAVGAGAASALASGDGAPSTGGVPFTSQAEIQLLKNDPRYLTDAAYTAAFNARLLATSKAGKMSHQLPLRA